ncbi:MAG: bifunctional serine/threonine-protein kinase/formylglycine-generating enzyme family protein [Myxococcales bacterium]|nr:bifunctional serine/threonine-protein kinase/formylglycine-generating enzyme family protein [Myxococcota bacterium]MDW8284287.1 bifunctional serine/threonine-protein kinase/formylglycine-generating enzyme family protein [Myxococcales bacterium]
MGQPVDREQEAQLGPDLTGRTLGNWRLVRRIGVGGFGAVYEAENIHIERQAALKVLHPHMALHRDLQQRFLAEASAASKARHPGIVEFYDGGFSEDGLCYMVMELLRGTTLHALLAQGALSPRRTARLGARLAEALAAVHRCHVVHRDLKPENILLQAGPADCVEAPKILDFGIAKLRSGPRRTVVGMVLGTPEYMSPEQWQMLPEIDGRADAYSLGVILFECLTGHLPFSAENEYQWQMAHLYTPAPDPQTYCPHAPRKLTELIRGLLAKLPADRPGDLEGVAADLSAIAAALPEEVVTPVPRLPSGTNVRTIAMPNLSHQTPPPTAHFSGADVRTIAMPKEPPRSMSEACREAPPDRRSLLWRMAGFGALMLVPIGYILLRLGTTAPKDVPLRPATQPKDEAPPNSPRKPELSPKRPLPPEFVDLGSIALMRHKVTIGEFRRFVAVKGLTRPQLWPWEFPVPKGDDQPMFFLSQELGAAYCAWRYPGAGLPSAAELSIGRKDPAVNFSGPLGEWTRDQKGGKAVALSGAQQPQLAEPTALVTPIGFRCALPKQPQGGPP